MKPINEADWLSRLNINITSNSNRIFNNGNQQLEITVGITPRKGETVSEEQLNSVRLMTLEDNGQYQELSRYRVSSTRDSRFEYYANTGSPPERVLESTTYRRKFYVSSVASGGSLQTIYAAITRDPDSHYVSHTSIFNSSVTIETITRPQLRRSDFKLERINVREATVQDVMEFNRNSWPVETAVDIDLYHLEFKNPALRIVDANALYSQGLAAHSVGKKDLGEVNWAMTFKAPLLELSVNYLIDPRSPIREFIYRNVSTPINTRAGSMNFLRLQLRGVAPKPEVGPLVPGIFSVFDQYGNPQLLRMTPQSEGNLIDFEMYH